MFISKSHNACEKGEKMISQCLMLNGEKSLSFGKMEILG